MSNRFALHDMGAEYSLPKLNRLYTKNYILIFYQYE